MMISETMCTRLNEQITNELGASQTYLAMACMFESMNLKMLAKYFRKQTEEERGHALKILDYVLEVGGRVRLQPLAAPKPDYKSVAAAIDAAVAHEEKVTQQIHSLAALAEKERDYSTRTFLQWYIDEQVEEISSMSYLAALVKMAGEGLLQLEAAVARLAPE
jgi:ferritin